MQFKHTLFQRLAPFSGLYRWFKVLAVIQLLVTAALPVVLPQLQTSIWLLNFALFAFLVTSYALLRMAYHHDPEQKGFGAWVNGMWENLTLLSWMALLLLMVIAVIKLILYMLG